LDLLYFSTSTFWFNEKSNYFSIKSIDEAVAYLNDPIHGFRIRKSTITIFKHKDIKDILGSDNKNFPFLPAISKNQINQAVFT
jgi:uncharacterized protein (DUF1810 family)